MTFFPLRSKESEWMDDENVSIDEVKESLNDLRFINRYLGGAGVVLKLIKNAVKKKNLQKFSILDVATGSSDIPRQLIEWGRKEKLDVSITALDKNLQMIKISQEFSKLYPEISFEVRDFFKNSYSENAFDFCISSLFLHHLSDERVKPFLKEMFRLCRHGVIINDLVRGIVPYVFFKLIGPLLRLHPMTRHDGAVSIQRAFTLKEIKLIAQEAGFHSFSVRKQFPYRMSLVLHKG